jgi:hypothetical protein
MLAHQGHYGFVTHLSRETGVSRQTLYSWAKQGRQALEHAFTPPPTAQVAPVLARQILDLLVESHPSYRGIQACLARLTHQTVSLGTIAAVIAEAQRRALDWMASHAPASSRTLALDEIYGNHRCGAYLNVVDTLRWAVWAAEGPLPVDSESWTLVLWLAQDRGLHWHATITDGGAAVQAARQAVDPDGQHGRDVWHIFHACAQVQGRLERRVARLREQTTTVARQAGRVASGQKARGPNPKSDAAAHAAAVAQARQIAEDVRYLTQELRELLEVVVVRRDDLLSGMARRADLDALLVLLAEVGDMAPVGQQQQVRRLHKHLAEALPSALAFVAHLDAVQQDMRVVLGTDGVAVVAWAWQRRAILGPSRDELLALLPEDWRGAARVLLLAWEQAVRASSAVENWHSIVRPHLAVHRTLSSGMLALLAVWHNHGVFTRGIHAGSSPLQLSGMSVAPTDWLIALGYPPEDVPERCTGRNASAAKLALAA